MANNTETNSCSQGMILGTSEVTLHSRQLVIALALSAVSFALTVVLCVGAFRLGVESSKADIYERQNEKIEQRNIGLMALVGVVDRAKASEFASCVQTGRVDCVSIIAPITGGVE